MFDLQVAPSHLWIVRKWSKQHGVMHVALVEWVPSWSHPDGDPRLSKVIELSSAHGLNVRAFAWNEGWSFVACIDGEPGVRARLAQVLRDNAPYDLVLNNCEHMVSYVATGVRKSPQVRNAAVAVVGLFALVAWINSAARRIA